MTLTPEERVRMGAELLDEKSPHKDWREKIDAEKLSLFSDRECVLGQVYGGYVEGRDQLEISNTVARVLGFNISTADRGWGENPERVRRAAEAESAEERALRQAWVELVNA